MLRQHFAHNGTLRDNDDDRRYRRVQDQEPVFAFAKSFDLSNTSHKPQSVLFTLSYIRDPVVQYAAARGITQMRPLWKTTFHTDSDLTQFHYHDYDTAARLAKEYSEKLATDAYRSGSAAYIDIVSLSARQVLGGTEFAGTLEQPLLFLKEISSDGNCQTIDVIFPAFPFFLYTNPQWLAYLLEPLIEHMLSGQYPNKYAMHDLGSSYPNVTGHPDGRDEYMPVEECGDILIMGLAIVNSLTMNNRTGSSSLRTPFSMTKLNLADPDTYLDRPWTGGEQGASAARAWLTRSYTLWKQWTGYLVDFTLEPHNQLSTDDFAGRLALQTNLALKGIIGIRAMSELASLVDNHDDAKEYRNISETYIKRWQELAISRDGTHAKLAYDWQGSWTTLYSLYADAVLCFHPSDTDAGIEADAGTAATASTLAQHLEAAARNQAPLTPFSTSATRNFIPTHIYQQQSDWYASVLQKYGLPLDQRHLYSKSDWAFEAAAVAAPETRKAIVDAVARWIDESVVTDRPLTDLYQTEGDGGFPGPDFFARPVVGGHFAFLVLEHSACGGRGQALSGLRGLR